MSNSNENSEFPDYIEKFIEEQGNKPIFDDVCEEVYYHNGMRAMARFLLDRLKPCKYKDTCVNIIADRLNGKNNGE